MKRLTDRVIKLLENVPDKRKPPKITAEEKELEFQQAISPHSKALLAATGKLTPHTGYYLDEQGRFFFFELGNALKGQAKDIAKKHIQCLMSHYSSWPSKEELTIGFILWLQQQVIYVQIDARLMSKLLVNTDLVQADYRAFYEVRQNIGQTIKDKDLPEWSKLGVPVQIFISANNKQGKVSEDTNLDTFCSADLSEGSRKRRLEIYQKAIADKLTVFVHAPYFYSPWFCNRCRHPSPQFNSRFQGLILDLKNSAEIGAKGVVIHVGHNSQDIPLEVATERMKEHIIALLSFATPECPLLLETPAGQGQKESLTAGELLCNIEDFIAFYSSIPKEPRKKFGICVDTCHVYAAGYDPLEYLEKMEDELPGAIKFVHFNDSKGPRGCKVDRHFHPGGGFKCVQKAALKGEIPQIGPGGEAGHIGVKRLTEVALWCIKHKVPMVTE